MTWSGLFGAVTAFATAISAFVLWRQQYGGFSYEVLVEAEHHKPLLMLRLKVRLQNQTRRTWEGLSLSIFGAPGGQLELSDRPKGEGWAANSAPLMISSIDPGSSATVRLDFSADWESWFKSASRRSSFPFRSQALCIIRLYARSKADFWCAIPSFRIITIPMHVIEHNAKIATQAT